MAQTEQKLHITWDDVWKNALRFIFNVSYTIIFPMIFGMENVLPSVALCVGLTMLPYSDLDVKPSLMAATTVLVNLGCGLVSELALSSPWIALPVNLIFVSAMLFLTCEPKLTKPSISFLLCFVFCQSTPVPVERLPIRLLGLLVGSGITALVTVLNWRRHGWGAHGRNLKRQIAHCFRNWPYVLRMSVGLAVAMFIGMSFHSPKPLWISIVVMSLTQMDFGETWERIKLRTIGTVIGVGLFIIVFGFIVPREYAMVAVLLLGYLSFFTSDYKHKTVVNAVSAINASLVLLDTGEAIEDRIIWLAAGIVIVLVIWVVEFGIRHIHRKRKGSPPQSGEAGQLPS